MTALAQVTLEDKYTVERGRIYLSGLQALVRLPLVQRSRDAARGLETAGFISGYRGSPLGGLDVQLWQARPFLERARVLFRPAVNEDLAATMVWGTQQVTSFPGATVDGVFGMWYGKGPGVDRSGDAFKHANFAGTSRHGGVLAVAGDDHAAKSSTLPHQSEYAFMDCMMPVLHPADVQDILDFGIYGWALSRWSGCWVALKVLPETCDRSASVLADPDRVRIVEPADFEPPEGGLNFRLPEIQLPKEFIVHRHRMDAVRAFARANALDRIVRDGPGARFGIVTTGKSSLDVMQALEDLGIDEREAARIGLRVYKVAMVWPLEPEGARRFADGLEEVLVVEEKRGFVEDQLKALLYDAPARPRVVGKRDEHGAWLLPSTGELSPAEIARVIAKRIARFHSSATMERRLAFLDDKQAALARAVVRVERLPYFCSGCPHNTSTRVPEGSRALAGIGCHYMAQWMGRETATFTHMGAEGCSWIGQAPFTATRHVFVNIGDGTYYHSGFLAIRAAVASGANITYKILYNDAVAMTGGQPVDGPLGVSRITRQLAAEGVKRIAVVSPRRPGEPDKYPDRSGFAPGVTFHGREALDALQCELREVEGVSALIYDGTCATEKRRRRKRGRLEDPPKRVFINEHVCEGCGDCSRTSNCLSVVPLETELGRKRRIDQSACNKDFTCLEGFCPSFVTVHGGELRRGLAGAGAAASEALPEPDLPSGAGAYDILVTGVGGTGVVTIGALLGMAAHLEGKHCSVLDQTGLAQKYGAVMSHVRIAQAPGAIHAARIATGGASLLLGCDLVVSASLDALATLRPGASFAVVNEHPVIVSEFTRNPDLDLGIEDMKAAVAEAAGGADRIRFVDATDIATALLGDAIAANVFMLGFAWQQGRIPLSAQAIDRAIALNGVAVELNRAAFLWGRRTAHDADSVRVIAGIEMRAPVPAPDLATLVERRADYLGRYQDAAYAARYRRLIERVEAAERSRAKGMDGLAAAAARGYFKLLAYKDEYEVARLYAETDFLGRLRAQFSGDYSLRVHLAPPLLARRDPRTGHPRKRAFGPWMLGLFGWLAKLRGLRGTPFDPFGYSAERRLERALIGEYERTVEELLAGLDHDNHGLAVEIARLPDQIRGFGHVKRASLDKVRIREAELLAAFRRREPLRAAG
jgi:indolepyruvate ferredoxin oxidoreductase